MDNMLGIHSERNLPEYVPNRFRSNANPNNTFPARNSTKTSGKVVIYATCFINYNEPGIGHDLLQILEFNEILAVLVEKEVCCGMPQLELGNSEKIEALKNINISYLVQLAKDGCATLSAVPSCTLMYKQELPLLFPDDEDVLTVAAATFDPFEYLLLRQQNKLLRTDFKQSLGRVSYHIPCHLRVQNIGKKKREICCR